LAIVKVSTRAAVDGAAALSAGDASITAGSNASTVVSALPALGGVSGTTAGVGASVALALVTDTTSASLGNGGALTSAKNLTLSSTAVDSATAEARMGAAGGKVALAPAVAVTVSTVTTSS